MTTNQLKKSLTELAGKNVGKVLADEPLSHHNSWNIGGRADLLIEPENSEQVGEILRFVDEHEIPLVVIGQGTNLLFDDAGVRGVVVKVGSRMADIQINGERIVAEGGAWVPHLARRSMQRGLSGLEHCIGIPGTVGGLVMMNGGSHRKGIGDNVVSVTVVNKGGAIERLTRAECNFSYRHSDLQGSGCVVVAVELSCPLGEIQQIRREMLDDLQTRRRKFPRKQPNCGSVFLSSAEMHATVGPPGKIIETAGLKGLRIGRAEISQQHANFIINLGDATSADVLALIARIRGIVKGQIGFNLDCEVRYVSPQGEIQPAHLQADELGLSRK